MWQFILTNVLMLSLGAILYLIARAVPRIDEPLFSSEQGVLERWLTSDLPHQLDQNLNRYLGKLLRRVKIGLLRADNHVTHHLRRIQSESQAAANPIGFSDVEVPRVAKEEKLENN